MRKLAFRLLLRIPPFSWILTKILSSERRILELEWAVQSLKAQLAYPRDPNALHALFAGLVPQRVIGHSKIRLGDPHDGGYVMLDDFASITHASSLGIADNVSWDLAMAERGIPVEQFDFSIARSPVAHPKFRFHRTRVSSLDDILVSRAPGQVLKIDIEGSEWNFFADAPADALAVFTQIVGEFHDFHRFFDPAWRQPALRALRKLNETHQLIHWHANNTAGFFLADSVRVPVLFEFTFVLRAAYRFEATDETFPGPLDASNLPDRDDLPLDPLLRSALCGR